MNEDEIDGLMAQLARLHPVRRAVPAARLTATKSGTYVIACGERAIVCAVDDGFDGWVGRDVVRTGLTHDEAVAFLREPFVGLTPIEFARKLQPDASPAHHEHLAGLLVQNPVFAAEIIEDER